MSRDWSQQELADRAGLSRAGISAIESGRLAPSVTAAMALARVLCCTVEDLFAPQVAQGQVSTRNADRIHETMRLCVSVLTGMQVYRD